MLRSLVPLHDFIVQAKDVKAGTVKSFLFNERNWVIRYFVVDTGVWLSGKQMLVAPVAIEGVDWKNRSISVYLTKEQIENGPDIDTRRPMSKQKEAEYANYFNWPIYWRLPLAPPPGASPVDDPADDPGGNEGQGLRSTGEVTGYRIHAIDGIIGHVEDFIADDGYWKILYMVVGTGKWSPGKRVLISSAWATGIDWERRLVYVDLRKDRIKNSPEYDPGEPVNREVEEKLYDYHGRPRHWENE